MEKLRKSNELSRREFLKFGGTLFTSAMVASLGLEFWQEEREQIHQETEDFISDLQSKEVRFPDNDIPQVLRGFYPNMVQSYLIPDKAVRQSLIDQGKKLGAKRARVTFRDEYEPVLGRYNTKILDKAAEFAYELEENGMGVEIDFYDCFFLGNGAIPTFIYGTSPPTSPYNKTNTLSSYKEFFTDTNLRNYYKDRVGSITSGLQERGVKNILAWVPLNEPFPSLIGKNGKNILTQWFDEDAVPAIRNSDSYTPIISGVASPSDIHYSQINGLAANTAHLYPGANINIDVEEPLIIQEFGTPYRFMNQDLHNYGVYEYMSLKHALNILKKSITAKIDPVTGKDYNFARVSSFGGWKIAGYDDGISFEEKHTQEIFQNLIQSLQILQVDNNKYTSK